MNRYKKILIIGFSGSGKTYFTNFLKEAMSNRQYFIEDLDDLVAAKLNRPISDIIDENGWGHFRKIENEILIEFLQKDQPGVISLGGGTVESFTDQDLKDYSLEIIWLKTTFENCWDRGEKEKMQRPIFRDSLENVKKLFKIRSFLYEKWANKIVELKEEKDLLDLSLYISKNLR